MKEVASRTTAFRVWASSSREPGTWIIASVGYELQSRSEEELERLSTKAKAAKSEVAYCWYDTFEIREYHPIIGGSIVMGTDTEWTKVTR